MENDNEESDYELNRDNLYEPVLLFVQHALKTIDKNVLMSINSINKSWKSEISNIFKLSQKKLISEIITLNEKLHDEQKITNELLDLIFDDCFDEEDDDDDDDDDDKIDDIPIPINENEEDVVDEVDTLAM